MKNKIYGLIGAVLLLAVLIGAYVFLSGRNTVEEEIDETNYIEEIGSQIINAKATDSFSLTNEKGSFEFNKKGNKWQVKGYDNSFNSSAISSMATVFESLYASQVIEGEELSKYGIDKPSAVAVSGDTTIKVGTPTADSKYYYIGLNDDNKIYMVNYSRIQPLTNGFNEIIDKSVQKIDTNTIQTLTIDYREDTGKRDIDVRYDKDSPLAREYSEKNGLATLVMEKPVSNMLVYPYNLQTSILKNSDSLNISDLVEINPTDLSKYGLDKPEFTLYVADKENSIKVSMGNIILSDDTQYAYVLVNDRPEVFTMSYRALKPFAEAKLADFVEKFVSLYQRSKVNKIDITGNSSYKIEFKAEGENDFRTEDGVTRDYRNTYINGKLIDKKSFTDLYELIVGIGFDDIDDKGSIQGEPEITITFDLMDGSKDISEYYNYNDSFYAVNKGGESVMYVSKQTVRRVLSTIQELVN